MARRLMLTIRANDIGFAGLVANIIAGRCDGTGVSFGKRRSIYRCIRCAEEALDSNLPGDFAKLRGALKPYLGGNLQRVIGGVSGTVTRAMANGGAAL